MSEKIRIAVDAMGGENSPKKVIDGILLHHKKSKDIFYKIFGDKNLIEKYIPKNFDKNNFDIVHTEEKIEDTDTALGAAKKGKKTSMWLAIESVKNKEADGIISSGNTGALFILSKMNLKMIQNIDKPALAGLWPNKLGMNVVLDLGANVECNEKDLSDFSIMGSALIKALFDDVTAKVSLLNIGSEELKGNEVIKKTYQTLTENKNKLYEFNGFIEANQIMDGNSNVVVTDGFTGNVALKTAEGTANFITSELKKTMSNSILGKISALLNIKNLKNFKNKFDPRKYNGAILLGLTSPVVKSHGSTDYLGFFYSLEVCEKTIKGNLIKKITENMHR